MASILFRDSIHSMGKTVTKLWKLVPSTVSTRSGSVGFSNHFSIPSSSSSTSTSSRSLSTLIRNPSPNSSSSSSPSLRSSSLISSSVASSSSSLVSFISRSSAVQSSSSSTPNFVLSRSFHTTLPNESTILIAGLSVAGAALVARFALQTFAKSSKEDGTDTPVESKDKTENGSEETAAPKKKTGTASEPKGTHHTMGADFWAKQMYKGGFEDKMSRREAALILGVRESADPKRIQDRHRKMLIANHPDVGGSTFIAGKINEAKDVLLKGKATS